MLTWLIVGGLMLVCGIAMARMMWIMDGRPPLRKPEATKADQEPDADSDTLS